MANTSDQIWQTVHMRQKVQFIPYSCIVEYPFSLQYYGGEGQKRRFFSSPCMMPSYSRSDAHAWITPLA